MGDKSMVTPSTSRPSPDEDTDGPSPSQSQPLDQTNTDDKGDSSDDVEVGNDAKTTHPVQKRRRVTRACDECRRKKIKCDGKQPCTHCTVYSYGQYPSVLAIEATNLDKNVPMTSPQTEGETLLLSILRRLSNDCRKQKRFLGPFYPV